MSPLDTWMAEQGARLEQVLDAVLPPHGQFPIRLHTAMRYAALAGGKHFRPLLAYATAEALDIPASRIDPVAAALELIHAYSLVHDDLPAMDDDALRRGKPTCHIAFDEATAILVGDGLQALAFELLAQHPALDVSPAARLRILARLANAAGSRGMVGGQAIDLESEGRSLNAAELEAMHIHKTGALIRASVVTAAWCSEALDDSIESALDHYAKCVGLAFQIHDDVLDETGSAEEMGKNAGADRARAKSTYPALFGLSESRQMARGLVDEACTQLHRLGAKARRLEQLAEFVIGRRG